jgi:hypothetical protein
MVWVVVVKPVTVVKQRTVVRDDESAIGQRHNFVTVE